MTDLFAPLVDLRVGDALAILMTLPTGSVHCVITSPPYFGLRDYKHPGQIGLEQTPADYVARLVAIFREIKRVLRDDGVVWLNLGDTYANGGSGSRNVEKWPKQSRNDHKVEHAKKQTGLPIKSLIGIPWRVAFALQDDGWILRQDIIWSKPNPMPESVYDRFTKSHEYLFMFAKSNAPLLYRAIDDGSWSRNPDLTELVFRLDPDFATWKGSTFTDGKTGEHQMGRAQPKQDRVGSSRYTGFNDRFYAPAASPDGGKWVRRWRAYDYWFDNDAVKEPSVYFGRRSSKTQAECETKGTIPYPGSGTPQSGFRAITERRNKRSVWNISTKPYRGAHFATFPPDLIEPCVLSSCPRGGVILDPFGGSGTTALVARRHQREAILIDINPDYAAMARERLS